MVSLYFQLMAVVLMLAHHKCRTVIEFILMDWAPIYNVYLYFPIVILYIVLLVSADYS